MRILENVLWRFRCAGVHAIKMKSVHLNAIFFSFDIVVYITNKMTSMARFLVILRFISSDEKEKIARECIEFVAHFQ